MGLLIILAVVSYCAWKLVVYNGEPVCRPDDCKRCPFPQCSEADKKRHFGKKP